MFKGVVVAFTALVTVLASSLRADDRGSLEIAPLDGAGEGAWLVTHTRAYASNSLLVECADGTLVLCDTPMTEAATLELLAWAKERFGERRWVVVNGHHHPDCTAGNAAMLDAGAEVWASDLTARLHEQRGRAHLDGLAQEFAGDPLSDEFASSRVGVASRTFPLAEAVSLPVRGERVEVLHPGPAHAPDNVVTHFVDRGVVFAGCLCFSADRETPGYTGDADMAAWPAALERVGALGAKVVVPGHGAPGGAELLWHTSDVVTRHAGGADADP